MKFNIALENKFAKGIYMISSIIGNRIYVGSTVNFWVRYSAHKNQLISRCHHSQHLQRFVEKNGLDCLHFSIVEIVGDEADLLKREQFYLDSYRPFGKNGFNTNIYSTNRKGVACTQETKSKISLSKIGTEPHNKGKQMSPEQKKKLSIARTGYKLSDESKAKRRETIRSRGIKPHNLGKPMSEVAKQNLRDINTGKRLSVTIRAKISESLIGNNRSGRAVLRFNQDGDFIDEFQSVQKASEHVGTSRSNIMFCLKGETKTAGGYKWLYK